jgi:hypothetical protein
MKAVGPHLFSEESSLTDHTWGWMFIASALAFPVTAGGCDGSTEVPMSTLTIVATDGGSTVDASGPEAAVDVGSETASIDATADSGFYPNDVRTSISCGAASCWNYSYTPIGDILACCTASGGCGVAAAGLSVTIDLGHGCVADHQPGNLDPACAATPIANGPLVAPGCCTPGGVCGSQVDIKFAGIVLRLGCVDPIATGVVPDGGLRSCTPDARDGGIGGDAEAGEADSDAHSDARAIQGDVDGVEAAE